MSNATTRTSRWYVGRRSMLRGAAAAIGLPLLDAMVLPGRARAAVTPRFVVFYTPDGFYLPNWLPTATGASFALSRALQPLEPHKQDIVITTGLKVSEKRGDHEGTMNGLLTAAPPGNSWATSISIDQHIARTFGDGMRLGSLELGVDLRPVNLGRISYLGKDQPVPPQTDPYAVFQRLFTNVPTSAPTGDKPVTVAPDPTAVRRLMLRQSVLDEVVGQYKTLAARLGAEDRRRLETHLTSIRDIEARVQTEKNRPPTMAGPGCVKPDMGPAVSVTSESSFPTLARLQMDLLVLALACGTTRVASLMLADAGHDHRRKSWLELPYSNSPAHGLTHRPASDAVAWEGVTKVDVWHAQQFAYFLTRMKSIADGDGRTLLDNSLTLWCTDVAAGNTHSNSPCAYVLAGRAGGTLKTGRLLEYPKNPFNNDLHLGILRLLGLTDQTFGKAEWCTGPLPGLA